jgi:DNA replication protein DnaC
MRDVMKSLGLTQLDKALPALFEQAHQQKMTYETFLQRALDAEVEGRNLRAAERRIQAARLPAPKTLESFDFSFQPGISERLVWELADLSFVQSATNIIFLGPPGTGNTRSTYYPH